MKQKIVIKLPMKGHKSRSKVMKIAVSVQGIESAAVKGQDMNQIEVIGKGIDAVGLTELLRKKLAYAELGLSSCLRKNEQYTELLSVTLVKEENDGGGNGGGETDINIEPFKHPMYCPYGYPYILY